MNGTLLQFFHWYTNNDGQLWNELKSKVEALRDMGITALWLPPAYKSADGVNGVGYDAYDLYDLGEFDQKNTIRTKYGTREEYIAAMSYAQQNGLVIYPDIVLNHKMGGDEKEEVQVIRVDGEERNEKSGEPFSGEAYTKFIFPGRNGAHSAFEWNAQCFSGTDYLEGVEGNNVYKILNEYGSDWVQDVDGEKGNFDYLMGCDIEFRNPYVSEEIKSWLKWYWAQFHFDGIRIDAAKHISATFVEELLAEFRSTTKDDLFAVAEYWHHDLAALESYIAETEGAVSLFDVPLHDNIQRASTEREAFDLRTILDGTLVSVRPELAVTIIANHDTQPLQSLESPVEPWFKPLAYALILLMEKGYPCVFYPDLYGAHYVDKGNDGQEHEVWMEIIESLPRLIAARQQYAYGVQTDYWDHPNCIAWVRSGDESHEGCVVVLSNGEDGFKEITLGDSYKNVEFFDYLGHVEDTIWTDDAGKGIFLVNGGSVSVWVKKN